MYIWFKGINIILYKGICRTVIPINRGIIQIYKIYIFLITHNVLGYLLFKKTRDVLIYYS
jgi:hypothetical protein